MENALNSHLIQVSDGNQGSSRLRPYLILTGAYAASSLSGMKGRIIFLV